MTAIDGSVAALLPIVLYDTTRSALPEVFVLLEGAFDFGCIVAYIGAG